jgi:methyltransferase (TIGR00027 family)
VSGLDLTALGAAWGRAAHVSFDPPPYVLKDTLSVSLADESDLGAAELLDDDGRLVGLADPRADWRGTFAARARLVEDLVLQGSPGVGQYVILGAGLDTFGQRHADLGGGLRVFEVDEAGTQDWKRRRLSELSLPIPDFLTFVPVDFESGESWATAISKHGFDPGSVSVIASTGVTQYISAEAIAQTMRQAAELAAGTKFVCTFMVPAHLVEDRDREVFERTRQGAERRGFPWVSFYAPDEFCTLAESAGFDDVRHISHLDLDGLYFNDRRDGLRTLSGEQMIIATRSP